ncbi:MAG: helicase-associated domain-containing protein, partial [Brachybacterium sp.]|nr:helicase-associated domain-containing protein [Brachybacterium sp.]
AWAGSHHLAGIVGTRDAQNSTRAALSDGTRREGARTRRRSLIRQLGAHPDAHVDAAALEASLRWAFPLVPDQVITEEVAALLTEATALGVVGDGGLTVLGAALAHALDLPITAADAHLAAALRDAAPPPVEEVLLDADLTVVIPGRPAERLLLLTDWTEPISRGGALTARFTAASVRRALQAGRDPDELRELLAATSRSPVPQALEYLLRDEQRRHGQVRIGRASSFLTADEDVLTLFQTSEHAAPLALQRIAPTVAVTTSDPGFVLQCVRRSGLSPLAVGPDGRTAGEDQRDHTLRGGGTVRTEIHESLQRIDGPELQLTAAEAVARIRAAEEPGAEDPSVTDRLLEAIAHGTALRVGIVDGRGGVVAREAVPLSLEGGRLRARDARGDEEFTVLVHRVTLG